MSKYKVGDKFEIEITRKSAIIKDGYITTAGMVREEYLDGLKKIEPEVDWSKVEVDTPILVKYALNETKWSRRYFAKYEDGEVYAWQEGATSWSIGNDNNVTCWAYAKLAEVEE